MLSTSPGIRVGFGYDIHRLVDGRPLILGGVEIPCEKGLEGHSDADCLSHAMADAMLGAAGLNDIGAYFPPSDPVFAGLDSQLILKKALAEIQSCGYSLGNIDTTVIAETPLLQPHLPAMKTVLAESLNTTPARIGIKATTQEQLGALGAREGIAAYAVCLLLADGSA